MKKRLNLVDDKQKNVFEKEASIKLWELKECFGTN